jgi:hypothetical protein
LPCLYYAINKAERYKELKDYFGISKPVHRYITPLATGEECSNCSAVLIYPSRSARERGEKDCRACGHTGRGDGWSYRCTCDYCSAARAEEERRRSEAALQRAIERYEKHGERVSTTEHVRWALSKLTRRQKLFLRAFIQGVLSASRQEAVLPMSIGPVRS